MWLTYLEASKQYKVGRLTWDEYIEQLMSRAAGGGNIQDEESNASHRELQKNDPFAFSVFLWTGNYLLKDSVPLLDVFKTYRHSSTKDVETKVDTLRQDYALDTIRSLALLALQEPRADVLALCFKRGVAWNSNAFEREADRLDARKDSKTFGLLEGSEFRRIYPRKTAPERKAPESGRDAVDEDDENKRVFDPAKEFDVGGNYPVDW